MFVSILLVILYLKATHSNTAINVKDIGSSFNIQKENDGNFNPVIIYVYSIWHIHYILQCHISIDKRRKEEFYLLQCVWCFFYFVYVGFLFFWHNCMKTFGIYKPYNLLFIKHLSAIRDAYKYVWQTFAEQVSIMETLLIRKLDILLLAIYKSGRYVHIRCKTINTDFQQKAIEIILFVL